MEYLAHNHDHGMIPKTCPPDLKSLEPLILRAAELEQVEPAISYWCAYFVVEKAIAANLRTAEVDKYLGLLLDALDALKKGHPKLTTIHDRESGREKLGEFAVQVFDNADREARAKRATAATAQKFLAAVTFFDAFEGFGALPDDLVTKRKYAKIQAVRIKSALLTGKDPNAGRVQAITQEVDALSVHDDVKDSKEEDIPELETKEVQADVQSPIIPTALPDDEPVTVIPNVMAYSPPVSNTSEVISSHISPPVPDLSQVDTDQAQKHARFAISALNYEDIETAILEFRKALNCLGAK